MKEVELTELKKENKGSSVQAFALVDDGITCGIKVYAILCTSPDFTVSVSAGGHSDTHLQG